jgi:hypothetical protein
VERDVSEWRDARVEEMNVKWPDPMPEGKRLSEEEVYAAGSTGICRVMDPKMSCQQHRAPLAVFGRHEQER